MRLIVYGLLILGVVAVTFACGPMFPSRVIFSQDSFVLRAPHLRDEVFLKELKRESEALFKALPADEVRKEEAENCMSSESKQTWLVAISDFEKALGESETIPEERRRELVSVFTSLRNAMCKVKQSGSVRARKEMNGWLEELPTDIPQEFGFYLEGAAAYLEGNLEKATESWEAILDLEPQDRKYRSVWAAFMLGRVSDAEIAIEWFQRTRDLVKVGFEDNLGLAAASYGWEAQLNLYAGEYAESARLYTLQHDTGDSSARLSLVTLANTILEDPQYDLAEAVKNDMLRQLVTVRLAAGWNYYYDRKYETELLRRWLNALESVSEGAYEEAGRFAMLAYRNDDTLAAQRWALLAPKQDVMAKWIQAKLYLKEGRIDKGLEQMERVYEAVRDFGKDFDVYKIRQNVSEEIALLQASRGEYVEALDKFLASKHWLDAAYIAENVMTSSELKSYLKNKDWRGLGKIDVFDMEYIWFNTSAEEYESMLRNLLARKLMREKRWDEAMMYFDFEFREVVRNYLDLVKAAHDGSRSYEERARSFWEAAVIAREEGMSIFGTELYPDFAAYDGMFERRDDREYRLNMKDEKNRLVFVTRDERRRLEHNIWNMPNRRYHYRYIAASLAWHSASLLPNDEDRTASVLTIAGDWIKHRDPETADKFFKALAIRCGKTKLGQMAQKDNWLPSVAEAEPPKWE